MLVKPKDVQPKRNWKR